MLPGTKARRNDDILTENEILNALLPFEIAMPILAFMNRYLKQHSKTITDFDEFQPFLRSIFALSYYKCSVLDVETHPKRTGRCTLLQSSLPSLSSSQIDYVTQDKFIQYAQAFQESSKRGKHDDSPMEPFLDTRRRFIRSVFDDHEVTEMTCSQGGVEWHKARICFITSTGAYGILDRDASVYTSDEEALLADDIGLNLTHPMDTDEEEDFQGMTHDELKAKKLTE